MNAEFIMVGKSRNLKDAAYSGFNSFARQLQLCNISVSDQVKMVNNPGGLQRALAIAMARSDIIILINGLSGESKDNATDVICDAFSLTKTMHIKSRDRILEYYKKSGVEVPENALDQAMIPEGSVPFDNTSGFAPGSAYSTGNHCIILLPGEPGELFAMLEQQVFPYLARYAGVLFQYAVLNTFGAEKSEIDGLLADLPENPNTCINIIPTTDEVQISITASALSQKEAEMLLKEYLQEIVLRLEDYAYSIGKMSLEQSVIRLLSKIKLKLAVAEMGTQMYLSEKLGAVENASQVFEFGVNAGLADVRSKVLCVPPKYIKEENGVNTASAIHMAHGVIDVDGTDLGLGISCGESNAFVAVCSKTDAVVREIDLSGRERSEAIELVAKHALHLVWLLAINYPESYHKAVPVGTLLKMKGKAAGKSFSENR